MTPTFHKILIHGGEIARHSALPLGMLEEEAGESKNKLWKSDRMHHAKKTNRRNTGGRRPACT